MDPDDVIDADAEEGPGEAVLVSGGALVPASGDVSGGTQSLAGQLTPDGYLIALPTSDKLDEEGRRQLDLRVGIDPRAIEEAYDRRPRTYYELIAIAACLLICAVVLWQVFPWKHFFVPVPRAGKPELELAYLTEKQAKAIGDELSDEERTRLELTRLMAQGKHEAVKQLAESRLGPLPKEQWESWEKVWDFYFKALEKTKDLDTLRDKSQLLLLANPDSLSARYYLAVVLLDFHKKRTYTDRESQNAKRDAERAINRLKEAVSRLDTAVETTELASGDVESLSHKRERYRYKLAEAHLKRWWAGGYQDGDVDDVNLHRDQALATLERLGNWAPALEMRLEILRDIRRNWWWEHGSVFIKGHNRDKSDLVREMDEIEELLTKSRREPEHGGN